MIIQNTLNTDYFSAKDIYVFSGGVTIAILGYSTLKFFQQWRQNNPLHLRGKQLLEKALTINTIKEIYDKANALSPNSKPWTVEFVEKDIGIGRAECHFQLKKIVLHNSLSNNLALSSFVFELTNALSFDRFTILYQKAKCGEIECEEFAREIERIEYEGALYHRELVKKIIKETDISEEIDLFVNYPEDFETYWNLIKNSSHTYNIRQNWQNWALHRVILKITKKINTHLFNIIEADFKSKVS